MYIDIHNHTLFGVDDGPDSIEESIEMIESAIEQGVTDIVLTPHFRRGMFHHDLEKVNHNYELLKKKLVEYKLDINLHLGCEYHVDGDIIDNLKQHNFHTLADSDYVLTEYSHSSEYRFIKEYTNRLVAIGYTPVIAHIERYECIENNIKLAAELSDMGALIQVNANSILGLDGKYLEKVCKKLLKHRLADIVASDAHDMNARRSYMHTCFKYISKKYGEDYAKYLFTDNVRNIIDI